MKTSPFRRGLALFLCVQPVFWMSNVALAQSLDPTRRPPRGAETAFPLGSDAPEDDSSSRGAEGAGEVPSPRLDDVGRRRGDGGASTRTPAARELPAVDEPVDPEKYVCGPGDILELNFWGVQNFRLRAVVDLEGRAFIPRVGYFALGGKTLAEARRMMRDSVARYFPKLGFDVTLSQARTFLVQVVNAVKQPGSYPARAVDRVASVITRAGGLGPNASSRRIEIRRRDGTVLQADLVLYALTGEVKHNPYLLDGDVVHVPFEEVAANIDGAVNVPGRYELVGTRDLAELVTVAGGLAAGATRQLPIGLVRMQADDRPDQQLVDFAADGQLPAMNLKHDDRVHIPSTAEVQQSVMVIGAIQGVAPTAITAKPGAPPDETAATHRLPFVKGDSVRTLLERVGGVGPLADLSGSYVLRGGKSIPVDLNALVMLRDLKADLPVELGDTLVIPFRRQSVVVQGAVFAPGAYGYNPNYGIDQYVALAGGPNRFGQPVESARVIGPKGDTRGYTRDLKIEPGSQLVIPERNFSSPEIVQIIISAASVLVSGVAVVLAARK